MKEEGEAQEGLEVGRDAPLCLFRVCSRRDHLDLGSPIASPRDPSTPTSSRLAGRSSHARGRWGAVGAWPHGVKVTVAVARATMSPGSTRLSASAPVLTAARKST